MYRYAIIGAGGLGKVHLSNLVRLGQERGGDIRLCAVCGTTREALQQSVSLNFGAVDLSALDFSDVNFYEDYKELIDTERPDFAVSATPTFLHAEIALYALSHGVHLYSEKPMGLSLQDCDNMIAAAKQAGKFLMIGQSTRFSSAYAKLKEYVRQETFGKALRFDFCRWSQTPLWTWNNWILDPEKSGGCVLDMHIHDVDMINWMFGMPQWVSAFGTGNKCELENVQARYAYDGLVGTGSADWSMPQKFPFTKRFMINFERATAEIAGGKLMVYTDAEAFEPPLEPDDIHYQAMKTFLGVILDGAPREEISDCGTVRNSVAIALAEIESMKTGKPVTL